MVWRGPYWLPISLAVMLFIGSIINNFEQEGSGVDVVLTIMCCGALIVMSRRRIKRNIVSLPADPQFFFRIVSVITVLVALSHYAVAGLPLLSEDPNVARIEFMQSTWNFKVLKIFVPFMIVYAMAQLISNPRSKIENFGVLILLSLIQLASGGKGAAIWCAVFFALGYSATNGKLKLKFIVFGALLFCAPTVLFFKFIEGIDSWGGVGYFLLQRLTGIAEYGLFVVTNGVGDDIRWWTPLMFLSDLFLKLTGQANFPYTLSFGRRVTGEFYGGDPYSYVWELTVTALADLYVLFGAFGFIPALIAYLSAFGVIAKKIISANSLYAKCGWLTLWYHLSLFILTGSIVTELVVRTVPFVAFWLAGAAIYGVLFKSRRVF
ncbi:hypothetical protein [Pseudomonas sp. GL-RE-19]|uniref:hypothetical protein n=1 Tax=Pseudomonas sp. GL-RE-19 TaxID=2832389 RepID=UPI001CBD6570|nr:hypothetical protein [Pseudomonas sp. GL-RE-19]